MYKKIFLLFFLLLCNQLFAMDWGDKNPNSPIDMNIPGILDLLSQNENIENASEVPGTETIDDLVHSILNTTEVGPDNEFSANLLSILEENDNNGEEDVSNQITDNNPNKNSDNVQLSIPCPICNRVIYGKRISLGNFLRHFALEVVYSNSQLQEKVNDVLKQRQPHCFKCNKRISTELDISLENICSHLGSVHLKEILEEYGESITTPEFPHTIEAFKSYCEKYGLNYAGEHKKRQRNYEIKCQLCKEVLFTATSNFFFIKKNYLSHILHKHILTKNSGLRNEFFSYNNNQYSCLLNNCTYVNKDSSNMFNHLGHNHLQAILEQSLIITEKEINDYLEKNIKELQKKTTHKNEHSLIQQGKGAIVCQICNKGIGFGKRKTVDHRRAYLCHLMTHIKDKNLHKKSREPFPFRSCYLCGEVIGRKGRYNKHMVDKHFGVIFERDEYPFGKEITKEQIEKYLQNPMIIEKNKKEQQAVDLTIDGEQNQNNTLVIDVDQNDNEGTDYQADKIPTNSSKKRKLDAGVGGSNNNNEIVLHYPPPRVQKFTSMLDEGPAGPKKVLPIKETASYFQSPVYKDLSHLNGKDIDLNDPRVIASIENFCGNTRANNAHFSANWHNNLNDICVQKQINFHDVQMLASLNEAWRRQNMTRARDDDEVRSIQTNRLSNNNELSLHTIQKEKFADVNKFIDSLDKGLGESKETLSIEEMEKRLGI